MRGFARGWVVDFGVRGSLQFSRAFAVSGLPHLSFSTIGVQIITIFLGGFLIIVIV